MLLKLKSVHLILLIALSILSFRCGNNSSGDSDQSSNVKCTTANPDRWSSGISALISTHCLSCHSEFSSYIKTAALSGSIANQVDSGAMPQGTSLSSADKAAIAQWAACGAPQ